LPLGRQLSEQQSSSTVQESFLAPQEGQSGSLPGLQAGPQQPSDDESQAGKVFTQPPPGSQLSVVHASPSSQSIGSLKHSPPEQLSAVQALPSSQSMGSLTHTVPTQSSIVHGSESLQSPGTEHPAPQSTPQLTLSSAPSQNPSPQQVEGTGLTEQSKPSLVQRGSPHETGL
jgi:hypothetical protein